MQVRCIMFKPLTISCQGSARRMCTHLRPAVFVVNHMPVMIILYAVHCCSGCSILPLHPPFAADLCSSGVLNVCARAPDHMHHAAVLPHTVPATIIAIQLCFTHAYE